MGRTAKDREEIEKKRLEEFLIFDKKEAPLTKDELFAGVDEVGRGSLAGPVVAAAVILLKPSLVVGVNDSKKVSEKCRKALYFKIARAGLIGIGVASEKEIDEINIYQASRLAMKRAVLNLTQTPDALLIDGPMRLDVEIAQKGITHGDVKSACISAASIIAKVFRDNLMRDIHKKYPQYGFLKNKGYGTKEHMAALNKFGSAPIHRLSFSPVKEANEKFSEKN